MLLKKLRHGLFIHLQLLMFWFAGNPGLFGSPSGFLNPDCISRIHPVFFKLTSKGLWGIFEVVNNCFIVPIRNIKPLLFHQFLHFQFCLEKNRGTAQLPQNGTMAQGGEGWRGWVSRERGVGKEGEKGLLSAHVFKILRRINTAIVLTSIRALLTVCWKFTFFHQGLDLSVH